MYVIVSDGSDSYDSSDINDSSDTSEKSDTCERKQLWRRKHCLKKFVTKFITAPATLVLLIIFKESLHKVFFFEKNYNSP